MGRIEVICGPMFSGKSEELIRRVKRAQLANRKIAVYKSAVDGRYSPTDIVSHDRTTLQSIPINSLKELAKEASEIIAIDEIQFFPANEVPHLTTLAKAGIKIIVAGLDLDFKGQPFETTMELLARAENVLKLKAICMKCGGDASFSQRLESGDQKIMLGGQKEYEPRCRTHFNPLK